MSSDDVRNKVKPELTDKEGATEGKGKLKPIELMKIGLVSLVGFMLFFFATDSSPTELFLNSATNAGDQKKEQVIQLFDSIGGVELQSVNIGYSDVAVSSNSLLSTNKNVTVASGVVVVYSGYLKAPYEVSKAISLLLDVPIHQISILNTTDLGGN
ncbi:MAG: hypothetical protein ACRCST_13375 [Turicibacter sp.]